MDHRLLGSALARARWELDMLRLWRRDPGFYVAQTVGSVVDALLPAPPFTAVRCRDPLARVAAFPRTLEDARTNLDERARPFAKLAIDDLHDVGTRLRRALSSAGALLDDDVRARHPAPAHDEVDPLRARLDAALRPSAAPRLPWRRWREFGEPAV